MENSKALHDSFLLQLKESATSSYNQFYKAYELLNENKVQSRDMFITLIKNNDYLISSFSFYNDLFKDLSRSEDYLYIGQILTLQVKASHNLFVIYRSDNLTSEMNYYQTKKYNYQKELVYYYNLSKDDPKLFPIMEAFIKDVGVNEDLL